MALTWQISSTRRPSSPVARVTYAEAVAWAAWASEELPTELPTEA
ncbi:MAG: SUMF1/EgtB/PvdO family nonheme iron enzyme [Actinomycetales bacterium]|nr:SUMF1/EgtB/PvdO family nonheme iron enzyme [Actinomycetales bacterium]